MFEIVRRFESFDKVDRSFSAAVDFELLKNSLEEKEQFAKDYIDCEEKEYQRILDEFNRD